MQFRMRLRTMMILFPLSSLFCTFVLPVIDGLSLGPYTTWFNRRCYRIATEAKLIGRPECDVVKVMGEPTFIYGDRTYNYAIVPWFPYAKFQVHCKAGVVRHLEMYDD